MKRWIILGSVLFALLVAFFSWALYFLFWTPGGVHWLLRKVPQYSPLKIQVEQVTGRIAGDLKMEGLQVWWAGGRLEIQRLQTSLKPLHLLRGKILFEQILVKKISLEEKQVPPEPLDLTLPRVSGFLSRLDLEIRRLLLEEIRYRFNDDPPWVINKLSGRLAWIQGTLAINPLEVGLAQGHLKGALGLGLAVPSLGLDVLFYPDRPLLGADHLHLLARLKEGRQPDQLAGPMILHGRSGTEDRMVFRSDLRIAPHQITLLGLSFQEKDRKGTVGGQGKIIFESAGPQFQTDLKLTDVDFSPELKIPVRLTGDLLFEGTPARYGGRFDLKNNSPSWQAFRMAGTFQGNDSGLEVGLDQGDWLKGVFSGRVGLAWNKDLSLRADLVGRQIKPEVLKAGWPGIINLDLKGNLLWSEAGLTLGTLDLRLLESQFQGRPLKGGVTANWLDNRLYIKKADLQGRGFHLTADGALDEHLKFETQIADLSQLLPDGHGAGSARGWVRWRNRKLGGQVVFQGRDFSWEKVKAGSFALEAGYDQEKMDTAIELKTRINKGTYHSIPVDSLTLQVQGTLARQGIELSVQAPLGKIQAGLNGAYQQNRWRGTLSNLFGELPKNKPFRLRSPADLVLSPDQIQISSLVLTGEGEEGLTLESDLSLKPVSGSVRLEWQRLNLDRIRPWLEQLRPEGWTDGLVQTRFPGDDRLDLRIRTELMGKIQAGRQTVGVNRAGFNLTWDDGGLRSFWEVKLAEGGTWSGQASSTEKARLAFPSQGTFRSVLQDLDLKNWNTAVPAGLSAQGRAGGRLQGQWSGGSRWNLTGDLMVAGGSLGWKNNGADLQARLSRADLQIRWQEEVLAGNLALELENYGKASGEFSLPLPARFPLRMRSSGAVQATLSGTLRESGLVTALFPQAIRSSRGKLQWDLAARGTWEKPVPVGTFELSEGGADLPALGIRLQDLALKGAFSEDRIRIDSLVLRSGPGTLNGKAAFRIKDWKIAGIEGRLTGKDFQFVNRPDIQALGNPDLTFSGAPDQIQVKGKIEIPEALIAGGSVQGIRKVSPDVVIVDAPTAIPPGKAFPIQGEISLVFGEKVRVKVEGLNTLLKGNVRVTLKNSKDLKAEGEIRADQGVYLVQGSKLEISRGRLIFKGPPDNPGLDILAFRTIRGSQRLEDWVDEVKAGVVVTGTVRTPLVRLYSQPTMPESDIMSYILFGTPLGRGTDRTDLAILGKAARVLVGEKTETSLISRLDLDNLDIQSSGGDVSRSIVTVGKYLDPRLYLGLGGSLFSNTYQVILRYSLTPRLELETKGGTQSGGGIFFKVDFE
jgi:translocation and assembly module TamB